MDKVVEIFSNSQFGEIRTAMSDTKEPLFCLADVCSILDLRTDNVKNRLNDAPFSIGVIDSMGRTQQAAFITESNLYKVIFQSRKKEAEAFTDWVTSDVLPSIRKHGAYITAPTLDNMLDNPDAMIKLLLAVKEERAQHLQLQEQNSLQTKVIKEAAPMVEYYKEVLTSTSTYVTNQIAKELGMSAVTLNNKLHKLGIQYKQQEQWLLHAKYQNKSLTKTNTYPYRKSDGSIGTSMKTVWTEKGREFIHQLINK